MRITDGLEDSWREPQGSQALEDGPSGNRFVAHMSYEPREVV